MFYSVVYVRDDRGILLYLDTYVDPSERVGRDARVDCDSGRIGFLNLL